jgi:hypothetical protein
MGGMRVAASLGHSLASSAPPTRVEGGLAWRSTTSLSHQSEGQAKEAHRMAFLNRIPLKAALAVAIAIALLAPSPAPAQTL